MRDFDPTASEFISSGYLKHSAPGGRLYDPGTIMAAASVANGLISSSAAGSAADAQAAAAAKSDATQRYMYDTTRADNEPFRESGVAANNQLALLMGLPSGDAMTRDQIRNELLSQYTTTTPARAPVAAVDRNDHFRFGGSNSLFPNSSGMPGSSVIDEAGLNAAIERRLAEQSIAQAARSRDPRYGSLTRNFSAADMSADPVYQSGLQFGLDQGVQGINRQAAAGGNFLSGATLKALTRFGNDYASTKANDSYNRFNTNQNQQYNRLAGLSGAGQQATNQVSAAGQNMANNISASQQGVGNARGSAYLTQGNSWQNALNQGVSAWRNSQPNSLTSLYDDGYSTGTGPSYNGNYSRM